MNETQTNLVAAAREFATDLFQNKVSKNFKYHNLDHTRQVVRAAEEMADYYQLQPDDRNAVIVAAWFHDTGFASGESKGHEAVSVQYATDFLKSHHADVMLIVAPPPVSTALRVFRAGDSISRDSGATSCERKLFRAAKEFAPTVWAEPTSTPVT